MIGAPNGCRVIAEHKAPRQIKWWFCLNKFISYLLESTAIYCCSWCLSETLLGPSSNKPEKEGSENKIFEFRSINLSQNFEFPSDAQSSVNNFFTKKPNCFTENAFCFQKYPNRSLRSKALEIRKCQFANVNFCRGKQIWLFANIIVWSEKWKSCG